MKKIFLLSFFCFLSPSLLGVFLTYRADTLVSKEVEGYSWVKVFSGEFYAFSIEKTDTALGLLNGYIGQAGENGKIGFSKDVRDFRFTADSMKNHFKVFSVKKEGNKSSRRGLYHPLNDLFLTKREGERSGLLRRKVIVYELTIKKNGNIIQTFELRKSLFDELVSLRTDAISARCYIFINTLILGEERLKKRGKDRNQRKTLALFARVTEEEYREEIPVAEEHQERAVAVAPPGGGGIHYPNLEARKPSYAVTLSSEGPGGQGQQNAQEARQAPQRTAVVVSVETHQAAAAGDGAAATATAATE